MKQGQETNQIWTQEAGTDDTHNRTLTASPKIIEVMYIYCAISRYIDYCDRPIHT